jgi:hypothetical protein
MLRTAGWVEGVDDVVGEARVFGDSEFEEEVLAGRSSPTRP